MGCVRTGVNVGGSVAGGADHRLLCGLLPLLALGKPKKKKRYEHTYFVGTHLGTLELNDGAVPHLLSLAELSLIHI